MARLSFTLDAWRLYERGLVENLRYDETKQAIVLYDRVLIEDDAAGCGWPFDQDILGKAVLIRKELTVESPSATRACLMMYHGVERLWKTEPCQSRVRIAVNGHLVEATLKVGWNAIEVNPAFLVKGGNEIIIGSMDGASPAIIPIADRDSIIANEPWRKDVCQKSFKSDDGGKTWSPKLGETGHTAGEYMVRLRLCQFAPSGRYVSPVMDLADVEGQEAIKSLVAIRSFAVTVGQELPAGTSLSCSLRTGLTPVFGEDNWGEWRAARTGQHCDAKGRFFQVKLLLNTRDVLNSPAFKGLSIEAEVEVQKAAHVAVLKAEEYRTSPVIRSSIPFEYEPLNDPSLQQLRQTYNLDELVQGAADQFGRIVGLNHWVSQQWKWHPPDPYPDWNALEILEKQPNGQSRGGFCGQYAIVLVQCCLAMGIQARFVFGGFPGVLHGHEVVEVWSDDYGKWVLMDPNMDRYYLDRKTRVPLNALELHKALLEYYFAGSRLAEPEHNKERFDRLPFEEFLKCGPIVCHGGTTAGPDWFDPQRAHLMWGHPAMMPRNSFFSRPRPIPKAHGYGLPWSWNGYWHWYDHQTPRQRRFVRYTERESDFYWNLNQVSFTLEQTADQGALKVSMETFTPDLEAFLVSVDEREWTPSQETFLWRLREGANFLRMKVRNRRGVEGMTSRARITYASS